MNSNLSIEEYESIMNLIYAGEENIDLAMQILEGYSIDVRKFLLKEFGSLIVLKQSYVNRMPLYKIVEVLKLMTKTTQILSNSTAKNITIPPTIKLAKKISFLSIQNLNFGTKFPPEIVNCKDLTGILIARTPFLCKDFLPENFYELENLIEFTCICRMEKFPTVLLKCPQIRFIEILMDAASIIQELQTLDDIEVLDSYRSNEIKLKIPNHQNQIKIRIL